MKSKIVVVGSLNVDQIAYCSRLPLAGETVFGEKYETGLGGKGANQAAQAALLSAPGEVALVGAVGNDRNGSWYLEEIQKTGVDCSKIKTKESSTGVAPILVSTQNGENSIVVVPGANMLFTEGDLEKSYFEGTKIVVCQNEIPIETTRRALELGKETGAQTIYSPAPVPKREDFENFCEYVDFLVANETEALQLSETRNISEAVATLQRKYKIKNVIVTLGGDGFALKTAEKELTKHPVAEKVEVVDTTGAGDSFVGAFAHSLASAEKETVEHAKFASFVASRSTTRKGTQKSYFTRAELA